MLFLICLIFYFVSNEIINNKNKKKEENKDKKRKLTLISIKQPSLYHNIQIKHKIIKVERLRLTEYYINFITRHKTVIPRYCHSLSCDAPQAMMWFSEEKNIMASASPIMVSFINKKLLIILNSIGLIWCFAMLRNASQQLNSLTTYSLNMQLSLFHLNKIGGETYTYFIYVPVYNLDLQSYSSYYLIN